jgi:DNA-binding IclR family transcriptional regulator
VATSAVRLFDVIGLLRKATGPQSLTDIAKGLKIAPSSAHALLSVLLKQGIIAIDADKRYQLGPAIFYLGAAYARNTRIYRTIWNDLVQAAHDLDLAAAIAVPWEQHHLVLAVHQNGGPRVGVAIGSRIPLQAGSFGKVYYASVVGKPPPQLTRYTPATITSATEYRKELRLSKQRHFATDREEFVVGVGAVATAITADDGYQGLASLMSSAERMEQLGYERVGERLALLGSRGSVILGDRRREQLWEEQF